MVQSPIVQSYGHCKAIFGQLGTDSRAHDDTTAEVEVSGEASLLEPCCQVVLEDGALGFPCTVRSWAPGGVSLPGACQAPEAGSLVLEVSRNFCWKRGEVALLSPEGSHERSASVY